jgi:hypothetical protein
MNSFKIHGTFLLFSLFNFFSSRIVHLLLFIHDTVSEVLKNWGFLPVTFTFQYVYNCPFPPRIWMNLNVIFI